MEHKQHTYVSRERGGGQTTNDTIETRNITTRNGRKLSNQKCNLPLCVYSVRILTVDEWLAHSYTHLG